MVFSEANDVIIPASGETQIDIATASCVKKSGIALGGDLNIIRAKLNGEFLSYYLNYQKKSEIASLAQGNSVVHLYSNQLKTLGINYPSITEQQKIASFLSAVENRIQLLKQKKEKLQTYKDGVLHQIFSQQIRFKDENGNDFPDWKEKKLGEVYDFKSTNSLSREKLNYSSGDVKNIHYGDIHTKFRTHFDITQELVPFINTNVDLSRIKEECYVQEGDLIIADASEDTADIGKTIEAVNLNGEKVLAGLHTFLARRKDKTLAVGFAGHLMKSNDLRLQVMKIAQGTKVLSISTGRLANLTVKIPVVAEQQKIASLLTSLDKAIEAVQAQIDRSAEFKKGLLQQLFV